MAIATVSPSDSRDSEDSWGFIDAVADLGVTPADVDWYGVTFAVTVDADPGDFLMAAFTLRDSGEVPDEMDSFDLQGAAVDAQLVPEMQTLIVGLQSYSWPGSFTYSGITVADGEFTVYLVPTNPADIVDVGYTTVLNEGEVGTGTILFSTVSAGYGGEAIPAEGGGGASCVPHPTWTPDLDNGMIEFLDAPGGTFTIPNYMIRWEGEADSEMDQASLTGENSAGHDGDTPLPAIEDARQPTLHCEMTFWSDPDGTLYDNATKGMHLNLAILNALARLTSSSAHGAQTVRWTPFDGATPVTFEAHVLPVQPGNAEIGRGMALGIPLVIHDPEDLEW